MPKVTRVCSKAEVWTQAVQCFLDCTVLPLIIRRGSGGHISGLHGSRDSTLKHQGSGVFSLSLSSLQPSSQAHSWAGSSLLSSTDKLPAARARACHYLRITQDSPHQPNLGLVPHPGRKKSLAQGGAMWVGLGLNHRLLWKLGWRNVTLDHRPCSWRRGESEDRKWNGYWAGKIKSVHWGIIKKLSCPMFV